MEINLYSFCIILMVSGAAHSANHDLPFNVDTIGTDIGTETDSTSSIVLGDMDGDGDLDIVVGNNGVNRLYLNNGTSEPFNNVEPVDISTDTDNTSEIAIDDMDGDGDLDVVAANRNQTNRLYLNNGTDNPFNGVSGRDISTDTDNSIAIALSDIDNDEDLDVLVSKLVPFSIPSTPSSSSLDIFYNNGTSDPFVNVTATPMGYGPDSRNSLAFADLDRDGDLDFIIGNAGDNNFQCLAEVIGPSQVNLVCTGLPALFTTTTSVALGDVNNDGFIDFVTGNLDPFTMNNVNRLFLNSGTSEVFKNIPGINISLDSDDTSSVALGDVDGDGDLDVVSGNFILDIDILTGKINISGQINRLYLNNGTADPFLNVTGIDISTDSDITMSIAMGDMDGDGDLDLVVGNNGQPNRLYLNNSPVTYYEDDSINLLMIIIKVRQDQSEN